MNPVFTCRIDGADRLRSTEICSFRMDSGCGKWEVGVERLKAGETPQQPPPLLFGSADGRVHVLPPTDDTQRYT